MSARLNPGPSIELIEAYYSSIRGFLMLNRVSRVSNISSNSCIYLLSSEIEIALGLLTGSGWETPVFCGWFWSTSDCVVAVGWRGLLSKPLRISGLT